MIELYLIIAGKLSEINELQTIDLDENNDARIYPFALVSFKPVKWEELTDGVMYSDIQFTIKIEAQPQHRSASNSPVLENLKESLGFISDIKNKLINDEIDCISGVSITDENFTKTNGKYTCELHFKARAEYIPA